MVSDNPIPWGPHKLYTFINHVRSRFNKKWVIYTLILIHHHHHHHHNNNNNNNNNNTLTIHVNKIE
jgi:hypothetical protein